MKKINVGTIYKPLKPSRNNIKKLYEFYTGNGSVHQFTRKMDAERHQNKVSKIVNLYAHELNNALHDVGGVYRSYFFYFVPGSDERLIVQHLKYARENLSKCYTNVSGYSGTAAVFNFLNNCLDFLAAAVGLLLDMAARRSDHARKYQLNIYARRLSEIKTDLSIL